MRQIVMIPTERIYIPNPRKRNQQHHREIINNIADVGLKRPITVSQRAMGDERADYDLVCGQGRLEAFQALGHKEIPAFSINAKEDDCMLMSLVENIARRQHKALEIVKDIINLRSRGYNDKQIARKLGVTPTWVSMLNRLWEHGEERLIGAVEMGLIPISLAATIARSDADGIQEALADAYAHGLKGRKLIMVRQILEQRLHQGKGTRPKDMRPHKSTKLTADYLCKIYQHEVDKHTLLAKKADFAHSRLMFVIQAMSSLRENHEFVELLHAEGLHTLPLALSQRMESRGMQ